MSYYKELKELVLELRGGGFFLSPRDVWFLKFLEEEGYPLVVVREGIKKFFLFYPPEKRSKLPLFMSFGEIKKLKKHYIKKESPSKDWRDRFVKKLQVARSFLKEDIQEPKPKDKQEAEEFLMKIEGRIARLLWENLSEQERERLMVKFKAFRKDKELFGAMIKRELLNGAGIKSLSIFLD